MPQSWETKVIAIQEAKKINEITLDELIGNLQTYELRRSVHAKEEAKRDRGLDLKALEGENSDPNFEEIAVVTRKFKKYFKKAKGNINRKPWNSDHDQFFRMLQMWKIPAHVKNYAIQKEEQGSEQFRNHCKSPQ